MTENRYEKHCPCTVSELREFRKLGEIEGAILEEVAAAKETLERNQWILTAEKSGLLRLAEDGNRGTAGGNSFALVQPQSIYLFSFAGLAGRVCGCGKLYRYTGKGKLQTAGGTGIMREGKTGVFAEASAENYSGKSGFAGEAECEYAWEAAQNAARRDEGKRADLRRDSL